MWKRGVILTSYLAHNLKTRSVFFISSWRVSWLFSQINNGAHTKAILLLNPTGKKEMHKINNAKHHETETKGSDCPLFTFHPQAVPFMVCVGWG